MPQRSLSSRKIAKLCSYKRTRGGGVALFARHVSLMVESPGEAGAIAQFPKDGQGFAVENAGVLKITLRLNHAGEVAERAGDGESIV